MGFSYTVLCKSLRPFNVLYAVFLRAITICFCTSWNSLSNLIIKITISSIVIGLKNSYFPLILLSGCYWTVCYRTVQEANHNLGSNHHRNSVQTSKLGFLQNGEFFPLEQYSILEDSSEFSYPMAQMFMPTIQTSCFVDMMRCCEFQPSTASFLTLQQLQMEANIHPTEVPLYNISSSGNLHFFQQNTETMAVDQPRSLLVLRRRNFGNK